MRKTINISVSEEMYKYVVEQCTIGTVSEYFRSLVRQEQQRRADYAARPAWEPTTANDCVTIGEALIQLEKLKAILQRKFPYDQ